MNNHEDINEYNLLLYLPLYLKEDIDLLERGKKENSSLLDCLFCEVQGSINLAFYSNQITEKEADFLRNKYLGIRVDKNGY